MGRNGLYNALLHYTKHITIHYNKKTKQSHQYQFYQSKQVMIKFVVSRPVKKISRAAYHGETDGRITKATRRRPVSLKMVWIIFGIFVVVYGSFLLLKNTLFAQQYVITKVQYDTGDIQKYNDPYMYKLISAYIKKENYNIVRLNR
jgi:hypothetical protein